MTWKTVNGYPNYEVSIDGRIRKKAVQIKYLNGSVANYKEKLLIPDVIRGGYLRVTLSQFNEQKRFMVHRLVAEHFLPLRASRNNVNHKDGNKRNNHVSNLEWCTSSENELHSYQVLGKVNAIRKLTNEQAKEIRSAKGQRSCVALANEYGVSKKTILNIWNGRTYATA